jgi:TonB-linked SusC/RagA family outer membrane protein
MGAGGIPPNSTIRDLGQLTNLVFDQYGNGQVDETLESQFGRVTYQYNDKYMITGTLRRDGSSKFDKGHQYGVFPSGAVAWRMINEDFMKDITWLSDLKLRASYGEVGNEIPIPLFAFQALYSGNFASNVNGGGADNLGYPFNKIYQNGLAQTQPESPNLKWETDKQLNFGVDAAFMKGALTVTVDYFDRKSKDFLLHIQAPAQSGYQFLNLNVGDMENKGFEFAANYRGNAGREFHYDIGVTFTTIKNSIIDIFSGVTGLPNISNLGVAGQGWDEFTFSKPGGPVGEFYGYKSLGVFQTKAQIDALNSKAPGGIYYRAATSPGDRYFADMNGDGVVNADDRVAIGNPQPKFYGGINFDGSYKAWDFNLYFYGSYGNKIMNYVESDLESFQKRGSEGVENVSPKYFQNYWMPNRPSNRYSRALAVDDNTLNSVPSSVWVEDGSFLKLKNLVIGYTLPANIASKVALSKLRVYFSTQNLFFITKYSGLDPEIGIQGANATTNGIDNGTYPSSKFFTFGLNATF